MSSSKVYLLNNEEYDYFTPIAVFFNKEMAETRQKAEQSKILAYREKQKKIYKETGEWKNFIDDEFFSPYEGYYIHEVDYYV